jgi:hypothetical protein
MMIQLQAHIRQSLHTRSSSHVTRTGRAYQEPHLVFVHLRCAPCPPYAPPQQDLRYTLNPVYSHPYVTEAASRQCQLFLYFNSSQETYTHRAWDKGIGTCWIGREGWMGLDPRRQLTFQMLVSRSTSCFPDMSIASILKTAPPNPMHLQISESWKESKKERRK